MYSFISDTYQHRISIPRNTNVVVYSLFSNLQCRVPFSRFSIKYVGEGSEIYRINGNRYDVRSGEYLLANRFAEGNIEIESKSQVSGICIDILPEVISDVVSSFRRPDTLIPDHELDVFFNSTQFPENLYKSGSTEVGKMMKQLDLTLKDNPMNRYSFNNEFYYTLAEKVIEDHVPVYKQLQNLSDHKLTTGKELLRKVYQGKNLIDEFYKTGLDMSQVARECCMSEYHYYRIFKKVMGISPYQYLIKKRLDFALEQMRDGGASVSRIAEEVGFSDLAAFSKAFKKQFGLAPSHYFRAN